MSKIFYEPNSIFSEIITQLKNGIKDRNHGFHTPTFSNLEENGSISSRIIVLRNFSQENMEIDFHSDIRSKKIDQLKINHKTNFLFYDYKTKIQLRIKTISKIEYNNEITNKAWINSKLMSRKCYLTKKKPSSFTNYPEDGMPEHLKGIEPTKEESEKGYLNFCVINNQIYEIEWLFLSSDGHKRLLINIDKNQKNYQWLIP